ncbi:MAG: hypothetical protein ACRCYL_12075, partial [Kluyvera sp.]
LTAVLIGAPWVLLTPLSDKAIALFDRYLPHFGALKPVNK